MNNNAKAGQNLLGRGLGESGKTYQAVKRLEAKTRPAVTTLENVREASRDTAVDVDLDVMVMEEHVVQQIKDDMEDICMSVLLPSCDARTRASPGIRCRVWPTIWDIHPVIFKKLGVEQRFYSVYNALRFQKPFSYSRFEIHDQNLQKFHACITNKSQPQAADEPNEKVTWPDGHAQMYSASHFRWPPDWQHPDFSYDRASASIFPR